MESIEDETMESDRSLPAYDDPSSSSLSHKDLVSAVEESVLSCGPLVNFFYHPDKDDGGPTNARERREAICAIVRSPKFNKAWARRLFAGMTPLVKKVVEDESYLPASEEDEESIGEEVGRDANNNDEGSNRRRSSEIISDAAATQTILYLRACAFLVEAYLEGILERQTKKREGAERRKIHVIDEAFEVAEMLHELLFPLQSCGKEGLQTQSAIFSMCERWWHGNFEDREQMVTQLVPLLLVRSLDESAQKNDVKRLCSIRESLNLLDFEDESISSLKSHLLRTVSSPLFLQSAEGRKFISHLFQLHESLVVDLHRAIRVQIPGAKRSILKAYAEIYFNSWKGSAENMEICTSIEENALQDFMYQVIHAANPATAKSVRLVLDQFYTKKKSPDVESMLHRMYGPLLWRALCAANSRVRIQASVVLMDTFPLRDPEAGEEWTEMCVQKSVAALISLMTDDVPAVRVAGSMAAAKILSSFWIAIPSKDLRSLLNREFMLLICLMHAS